MMRVITVTSLAAFFLCLTMKLVDALKPDACASLFVYRDEKCTGEPLYPMTFPTFSAPGSPCYTDAFMPNLSVKDQYCNMETGNWHEKVYFGSKDCRVPWYNKNWSPFDMTFTTDSCNGGLKLNFCKMGACDEEGDDSSSTTTTNEEAIRTSAMVLASDDVPPAGDMVKNSLKEQVMKSHAELTQVSVERTAIRMRELHGN